MEEMDGVILINYRRSAPMLFVDLNYMLCMSGIAMVTFVLFLHQDYTTEAARHLIEFVSVLCLRRRRRGGDVGLVLFLRGTD